MRPLSTGRRGEDAEVGARPDVAARAARPVRGSGRAEAAADRRPGLTGMLGVLVLIGVTALGALADGLAGGEPGLILDLSLVAGTLAAVLLVDVRAVWVVIPAPPLVFAVMSFAAGVIGEQYATKSSGRLVVAAGTWVVNGFVAMATATLLAVLVTVLRMAGRRD